MVAPQFATYTGVTVPKAEILPCLAAYRDKEGLIPTFELGMFTPYSPPTLIGTSPGALLPPTEATNLFTPDSAAQAPPPSGPARRPTANAAANAVAPLGAEPLPPQHIEQLTRVLAETLLENDCVRQNIVPALEVAEISKLLHEQVPYSWMRSIVALFKEVSDGSPNTACAKDRFALTVWRIVHEELQCRRQGRLSAPGGPPAQQQGTPMGPGFAVPGYAQPGFGPPFPHAPHTPPPYASGSFKPGHCFRCGAFGHWSCDCPQAQQAGMVLATPQTDLMIHGQQAWDMSGPPPAPCRRCG